MSRPPRPPGPAREVLGSFVGMGGMACVLFVLLASGSLVPWWVVVLLTLVWLVLLLLGTQWFMHHPRRVALLPVVMMGVWSVVVFGGAFLLGWND